MARINIAAALALLMLLAVAVDAARQVSQPSAIIRKTHECDEDDDCKRSEYCDVTKDDDDDKEALTKKHHQKKHHQKKHHDDKPDEPDAKGVCAPQKSKGEACVRAAECDTDFCVEWNGKMQCTSGCNMDKDCPKKRPICMRTLTALPLGECVECRTDPDCKDPDLYCLSHWGMDTKGECTKYGEKCDPASSWGPMGGDCGMGSVCDSTHKRCKQMW